MLLSRQCPKSPSWCCPWITCYARAPASVHKAKHRTGRAYTGVPKQNASFNSDGSFNWKERSSCPANIYHSITCGFAAPPSTGLQISLQGPFCNHTRILQRALLPCCLAGAPATNNGRHLIDQEHPLASQHPTGFGQCMSAQRTGMLRPCMF